MKSLLLTLFMVLILSNVHAQNLKKGFKLIDKHRYTEAEFYFQNLQESCMTRIGLMKVNFLSGSINYSSEQELKNTFIQVNDLLNCYSLVASKEKEKYNEYISQKELDKYFNKIDSEYALFVKNENNIQIFNVYLENCKKSKYYAEINSITDDLTFQIALKKNTIIGYNNYLLKFPNGNNKNTASEKIEDLDYKDVKVLDTKSAYLKFIEKNPTSKYKNDVFNRIEELEFEKIKNLDTEEAYLLFNKNYPESKFNQFVLEELDYYNAMRVNSNPVYLDFQKKYPGSKYLKEISEEIDFMQCKKISTIKSYKQHLSDYPSGKYADIAKYRIKNLPKVPELIHELNKQPTGSFFKRSAAETLGKIADSRACNSLINALEDENCGRYAAYALGEIADESAIVPLINAGLHNTGYNINNSVAKALIKINSSHAADLLIDKLDDITCAVNASFILGEIGDSKAVPYLIGLLNNNQVGSSAAIALGKIGDEKAIMPLITSLRNKEIVRSAAISLGNYKDKRAVKPLIDVLNKRISTAEVAKALGLIGDPAAIDPLILALKDKHVDIMDKEEIATALGNIGDTKAIDPLKSVFQFKYHNAKKEAVIALGKIGEPAIDALIYSLKIAPKNCRRTAIQELDKIGTSKAIKGIILALKDEIGEIRYYAASKLESRNISLNQKENVYFFIAKQDKEFINRNFNTIKRMLQSNLQKGVYVNYSVSIFLWLGDESMIHQLIRIMNSQKDTPIPVAYINSGHPQLEEAAKIWAKKYGYNIYSSSYNSNSLGSWGNWRK